MTGLQIALTVVHLIVALVLIAVVLFQSSKSQGLSGSIAGGAETFFGKNKGRSIDGILAKWTVILAIVFVITSVSLTILGNKQSTNESAVTPGQTSASDLGQTVDIPKQGTTGTAQGTTANQSAAGTTTGAATQTGKAAQ